MYFILTRIYLTLTRARSRKVLVVSLETGTVKLIKNSPFSLSYLSYIASTHTNDWGVMSLTHIRGQ